MGDVSICCGPSSVDEEKEKYCEWRVNSAFSTLKEAEEIKKDSKMMALVQAKIKEEKIAIKSLEQMKSKISTDLKASDISYDE